MPNENEIGRRETENKTGNIEGAPSVANVTCRKSKSEPSDFLDFNGAAQVLNTSVRSVRLWKSMRGLPHYRITAKVIRFKRDELLAWANRFHQGVA